MEYTFEDQSPRSMQSMLDDVNLNQVDRNNAVATVKSVEVLIALMQQLAIKLNYLYVIFKNTFRLQVS